MGKRSVLTRPRQLFRMLPSNSVLLSPGVPSTTSPNLCLNLSPRRNVLMSPRRSAPGPEPTQGRSRSQLSRNGATFHQRSLALPKTNARTSPKLHTYDRHLVMQDTEDTDNTIQLLTKCKKAKFELKHEKT